jgi:hypothetical protein
MYINRLQAIKDLQKEQAAQGGEDPYAPVIDASLQTDEPYDFDHYKAAMLADINQLKQLKTIEAKAMAKGTMLEQYLPFVNSYVNSGDNYPNSVAVQVAIWLVDTGNIPAATHLLLHLIKQGIHHTPFNFDRTLEVFTCDAIYDWATDLYKKGEIAGDQLATVVSAMEADAWALPPVVTSKMYAMLAKHKSIAGEYATAFALCLKAEAVNPDGAGVKKLKETIESNLKSTTDSSSPDQATV